MLVIDSSSAKLKYHVGESLDTSSLVILFDGLPVDEEECDYSYDFSSVGIKTVSVTFGYAQGSYTVEVV